jgi:hypothetical protein
MNNLSGHAKQASKIFRDAAMHIQKHGWQENDTCMNVLLTVHPERWHPDMAVLMFATLSHELGSRTLSQFDRQIKDASNVVELFERVAESLESDN